MSQHDPLDGIPSLGDALGGAAGVHAPNGRGRVHKIDGSRSGPKPLVPPVLAVSRVHRIEDDVQDEPAHRVDRNGVVEPIITPFVAVGGKNETITAQGAKEEKMPRGHYKRTPRTPKSDAATAAPGDATAPTDKRKRTNRAKKLANGKAHAGNGSAPAGFIVDDYGRITIVGEKGRVELSLPDTKRLAAFVDRTKAFRA